MKNHWLDQLKERLNEESAQPNGLQFERLRESGIIDEHGEVTGQLRQWNAFIAITEIKRVGGSKQIAFFRCLKPVFGMPGGATLDISRDSMVDYLKEGKKIITAKRDDNLGIWKQGCDVRLTTNGFIRCDSVDVAEDDVGPLPEFQQTKSGL